MRKKKISHGCSEICGKCYPTEHGVPRDKCYEHALSLSKRQLIKACLFLFEKKSWSDDSFGGIAWAKAAKILQEFLKNKNKPIFIDSMFDVVHNGSHFFDKNEIFRMSSFKTMRVEDDRSELKQFLDFKKHNDILDKSYGEYIGDNICVSPELFSILSITHEWFKQPRTLDAFISDSAMLNILKYKPLKWGLGKVTVQKVPNRR
jgi:hypothetical protein